jgi:osmoprotectant transport system ATP-binding protein
MAATAVEFAGVSYILPNGQALLRDIDLRLEAGTTTAILGRSGSGKTTLLRMVNGLVQPTSGRVLVGGKSAAEDVLALRRSIGYVIQETGLFPHMTIERNVTMPLELANVDAAEKQRRGAEILSLVGLEFQSFRARYPWQLSGGQRQRVGLARALASDPEVLLMDEPFGALDPLTRAEMQSMLRDLLAKVQKTVLLVTHDLPEALYLAQRLIFVDAGQIVADLPSTAVFSSANPHVRRYVETLERMLPTSDGPASPEGASPTGASPSAPSPS